MRPVIEDGTSSPRRRVHGRSLVCVSMCAALGLGLGASACGGGGGGSGGSTSPRQAAGGSSTGTHSTPAPPPVRLSITPAGGRMDTRPDRGITVSVANGRIGTVTVRTAGDPVPGRLNSARTVWHSTYALGVSQRYAVTATATGSAGAAHVTKHATIRTFTPAHTVEARIVEGYQQTYGVGMPIILYFSGPVTNKATVERALQIKTSKRVLGSWYWDSLCGTAPECAYFRPRHYWPTHTRVSFTGHLNGVEVAPGVYGHHTLTQSFTIGRSLTVVASTSGHYMDVYRDGKHFAHWPISSGRPGDDTPNGNYLTIEKANPVEMKGPGYDIQVPYSVRFTWSGDYLHDAFWSVGEQGFTNVSHGCVNMSPADSVIYYNMAVPGDPVTIIGSPRPGTWDNGWTMWFMSWNQWLKGSAVHRAVRTGPHGSTFVRVRVKHRHHAHS